MKNELNVVTVESLTAGMISKTLVDIPSAGSVVYGGFAVYDTDAKRKFVNVATKGVYSHETSRDMATGALCNSRAMVSISVTGNAMPYPDHKKDLGEVWIGVALRGKEDKHHVQTYNLKSCKEFVTLCENWKKLTIEGSGDKKPTFASISITSVVADLVRLHTTSVACEFAIKVINEGFKKIGKLKSEKYDLICPPSWIIQKNIGEKVKYGQECDDHSIDSIETIKSCGYIYDGKLDILESY